VSIFAFAPTEILEAKDIVKYLFYEHFKKSDSKFLQIDEKSII